MNLLTAQATCFVAAHIFLAQRAASSDDDPIRSISPASVWFLLGVLEGSFCLFFALFLSNINRKYINTFFTALTAKRYIQLVKYHEADSDQTRLHIFEYHESYYESIRGGVKSWVLENFDRLCEESPDWFTERVKQQIPKDMIPESEGNSVSEKKGSGGKESPQGRRRSSFRSVHVALQEAVLKGAAEVEQPASEDEHDAEGGHEEKIG